MSVLVSVNELAILLLMAICVASLYFRHGNVGFRRRKSARYTIAALICAVIAVLITPADLLSTLVLSGILFGVFLLGSWNRQASSVN